MFLRQLNFLNQVALLLRDYSKYTYVAALLAQLAEQLTFTYKDHLWCSGGVSKTPLLLKVFQLI